VNSARITDTSYGRPYRPRLIRAANALGRGLKRLGLSGALTAEGLMRAAARRNHLSDFGELAFVDPLRRLLRSAEDEARLNTVGRWITRERLIGVLGNRLRTQRLLKQHPEIADQVLAPPIVITGLQRTGTTLLHRLLAADPNLRSLGAWEALNPAPLSTRTRGGGDRRRALARLSERALAYMAPDFFAVHPVEAEAPEEDCLLLDFSFLSPVAEATLRVPTYAAWLSRQTLRPAYRYMATLLELLQWQRPGRRWVLKTPAHLEYLDVLLDVFPGAKIIHTHRDPAQTVPSFCSMIAHGRGVFSDRVDPREIGAQWLARQSHMVHRAMELRQDRAVDQAVLDVSYRALIADPPGTLRRIYDFTGEPWTPEVRASTDACLQVNRQHRHGRHRYCLEDFGLDGPGVQRSFSPYLSRHEAQLAPAQAAWR